MAPGEFPGRIARQRDQWGRQVARTDRHASPVHFQVSRSPDGTHRVRVKAFSAAGLPSFQRSGEFLQRFSASLQELLQQQPDPPDA